MTEQRVRSVWRQLMLVVSVSFGVLPGLVAAGPAWARSRPAHSKSGTYSIEFLARPSAYFGHSYVRLSPHDGRSKPSTIGFYPKNVKAVFNAPGTAGATRADLRSKPTVIYRVDVTRDTYRKAQRYVAGMPRKWTVYDLTSRNCNHLAGDVARHLGLAVPGDYADLPENYVRSLQSLNGGRTRASWR